MAEKYELDRQIAQSRSCIVSAQTDNNNIDNRIARLKRALGQVDGVYQGCKRLRRDVSGCNPGSGWQGDCRNRFNRKHSAAESRASAYERAVDGVYDRIKDEIRNLNNRKNDNLGFIGDCEDVINNCLNALQKMVHDW